MRFSSGVLLFFLAPSIHAADPGYKMLMNTSRMTIYKTGKAKEVIDMRYEIATEAGAVELSNYRIRFPSAEAKFKLLKAEVKTEGKVFAVAAEDVKVATQPQAAGGIFEVKEVVIPLSQVKPGSQIQVKYQMDREALIDGVFGIQGGMANNNIAETESQTFLSELPLRYLTKDFDEFFSLTEKKLDHRYQIEIQPTEKARLLAGKTMKVGFYSVSTAQSWLQLNQALSQRYEAAIQAKLPSPLQSLVEEAKSTKESKQQIEKVAEGLKKIITYSGNWQTSQGRFFPSGHEAVVTTAKGDCKDYAVSMVAILRALGFKANVALTFRNEKFMGEKLVSEMAELPSLSPFNHAIVSATDSTGKSWWIDPTNPIVIGDVLSGDLLGNLALVLDGASNKTQTLPAKNSVLGKTTVSQTVKVNADNTVDVTAEWNLNPVAYNAVGTMEQIRGPENLKQFFLSLANPRTRGVVTSYERKNVSSQGATYSVRIAASDWLDERKGKRHAIQIFHPATQLLLASKKNSAAEFLEEGSIEVTTRVLGRRVVDPIDHECYGRSRWLDVDRTIENGEDSMVIVDRVNVKRRQVSKEKESDEFVDLVSRLRDCAEKYNLVTFIDPKQKTAEEVELDKLKGPPVDRMTQADADKLHALTNLNLRTYAEQKLLKFYSSRSQLDSEAYARLALVKRDLGYLRGDEYLPSYLEEGRQDVERGLKVNGNAQNVKLITAKIKINLDLQRYAPANQDFKILLEKAPKAFDTYYIGYRLNKTAKNYLGAERWLDHAGRVAATEEEKKKYHMQMADLMREQKKTKEALVHYEEILKSKNVSAWDWYNAGAIYCSANEFDKCIDYVRKALNLHDFATAKKTLSWALMEKAKIEIEKRQREKAPITAAIEEMVLHAIKHDNENFDALMAMSRIYQERYGKSAKNEDLYKGRSYALKAVAIKPSHAEAEAILKSFEPKIAEKSTEPAEKNAAPTEEKTVAKEHGETSPAKPKSRIPMHPQEIGAEPEDKTVQSTSELPTPVKKAVIPEPYPPYVEQVPGPEILPEESPVLTEEQRKAILDPQPSSDARTPASTIPLVDAPKFDNPPSSK